MTNPRKKSCKGKVCHQHTFQMTCRLFTADQRFQSKIKLCPTFNRKSKSNIRTYPILNNDRKYYTPFFIAEQNKILYEDRDNIYRLSFERRKRDEEVSIEQMMLPNHVGKGSFCKVCLVQYQDYQEHIESSGHRNCITSHQLEPDFKQLFSMFSKERGHENLINEVPIQIQIYEKNVSDDYEKHLDEFSNEKQTMIYRREQYSQEDQ